MNKDNIEVNIDQNSMNMISNFSSKDKTTDFNNNNREQDINNSLDFLKTSLLFNIDKMIKRNEENSNNSSVVRQSITESKQTNYLLKQFLQKIEIIAGDIKTSLTKQNDLILRKKDVDGKIISEKHFSDKRDVEDFDKGLVDQLDQLNENIDKQNKFSENGKGTGGLLDGMLSGMTSLLKNPIVTAIAGIGTVIGSGLIIKELMGDENWAKLEDAAKDLGNKIVEGVGESIERAIIKIPGLILNSIKSMITGTGEKDVERYKNGTEYDTNPDTMGAGVLLDKPKSKKPIKGWWDSSKSWLKERFGWMVKGDDVGDSSSSKTPPNNSSINEKRAWLMDFFQSRGWSKEQAAGIVGNLEHESGFDIKIVGDGGKAIGIAQWHPDRRKTFERIFKKPFSQSTLEDQAAFVDWELKNTEKKAGNKLKSAKTSDEASSIFMSDYERPSATQSITQRQRNAKAALGSVQNNTDSKLSKTQTKLDKKKQESKKEETTQPISSFINSPSNVNNSSTTIVQKDTKPYIEDESYHRLMASTGCYQAFKV